MIPILPEGGNLAQLPPPWNLKKVTSCAAVLQNTPKFSLAPGARHRYHIFQSKKPRKTQNFLFAPLARRKMVDSWYGAPKKTCQLFNVLVVLPPSGKIPAGAHGSGTVLALCAWQGPCWPPAWGCLADPCCPVIAQKAPELIFEKLEVTFSNRKWIFMTGNMTFINHWMWFWCFIGTFACSNTSKTAFLHINCAKMRFMTPKVT